MADHRADDHGERRRHRQIDSDADGERRKAQFFGGSQQLIDDDDGAAQRRSDTEHQPIQLLLDDALRQRGNQPGLRRGERFCHCGCDVRRADKSVRLRQQIEHRRNDCRAGNHADDQRPLLCARRRADELAGFQILQIVVRDRRNTEYHGRREQRIGDQRAARRCIGRNDTQQQGRAGEDREDADARDRTVRRANETRHVAADRCYDKTAKEHERQRRRDKHGRMVCERGRRKKTCKHERNHDKTGERKRADPARRHVGVAAIVRRRPRRARRGNGRCQSTRDGAGKFQQCPDRSDAYRSGTNEAHLVRPHIRRAIGNGSSGWRKRGEERHRRGPRDQ